MSGKRQHFVPQFLQKGFVSRTKGTERFTWVHRKDGKFFEANIAGIGAEGYFYTEGGVTTTDDTITDAERDYSALCDRLRTGDPSATADTNAQAELIAHFEIRTRHLRENFAAVSGYLAERVLDRFNDEAACTALVKRRILDDPQMLSDIARDSLIKSGQPESALPMFLSAIQPHLGALLSSISINANPFIAQLRDQLPEIVEKACKRGHIRALDKGLSPATKVAQYRQLTYRLIRTDERLLLGDSIIVLKAAGEREFQPYWSKGDVIEAVVLPLTSDLVLVGEAPGISVEGSRLPKAIAQCSLEYFICSACDDRSRGLIQHIGELAYMITPEEIDNIVNESFGNSPSP